MTNEKRIELLRTACQAVLDEFPAFDSKRIERVKRICREALKLAEGDEAP